MSQDDRQADLLRQFDAIIGGAELDDLRQLAGALSHLGVPPGEQARPRRPELRRPRRKYLTSDQAHRFLADLAGQSTLLPDPLFPYPAVCRDPDDDYLVTLATAHHANVLVTGDDDLLAIDHDPLDIEILTPRQLVDRLD